TDAPVGLHIEDGHIRHPIERNPGTGNFYLLPNGVFLVGKAGAKVVETSRLDDVRDIDLATQSGPLLLANNVPHPRFVPTSHNALIRSGVGVRTPSDLCFAVTRGPITFWDFARLFRDELGCRDALYLDGTISRLYAPSLNRYDDGQFMGILAVHDA
ncbi:MAG TPA: phosphodiester glycosidase family protein, partial [Polyangia bacterium]|nr:phosphodiester glycosidase family protein [Polyangia bacterium]